MSKIFKLLGTFVPDALSWLGTAAKKNAGKTNLITLGMGFAAAYFNIDAAQVAELLRTLATFVDKIPTQ